ncbi:MAG: GH92 family glycosyl hydrolase [Ignavibacteria bacterium]|nr:GH92 family glycosyl hydrolase [Ignavibacteria bacterium]
MKRKILLLFFTLVPVLVLTQPAELTKYVNVFNGTKNMGHTFPGACIPFGFVQLSPDTDTVMYEKNGIYNPEVYRYCSGYQFDDNTIVGFSHTHFSGTGHSDLGDFLIIPTTGELKLNPGNKSQSKSGYRSSFRKETEIAYPGYYSVFLDDYGIFAELTATERTGFHQYTFPENDNSHIILDLFHGIYNYDGKTQWAFIRIENDTLITGWRLTNGWARTRFLYFAMIILKPVNEFGFQQDEQPVYRGFWRKFNQTQNFPEFAGRDIKMFLNYNTSEKEKIQIKFSISSVSPEGALKNLLAEIPHWDFQKIKSEANDKWNNELGKIIIEGTEKQKRNFYTSLYHSFISPALYNDVDGNYRGLDMNIHNSGSQNNYTIFSLWDTYRALHPLFTILQVKRTSEFVNSMLEHYNQSVHKMLPVWSHYSNENWCMIGYHSVSVIADAILKKIQGIDSKKLFEAMVQSSNADFFDGIGSYKKYGFVPEDISSNSASKTLEYAYDDWTLMKTAEYLGYNVIAEEYGKRVENFNNIFDSSTGFFRAKNSDGNFITPFNPLSTVNQGYIEGNAYNYSLYVPHDVKQLINLFGGEEKFIAYIDTLFSMHLKEEQFKESEDITRDGIIGNYVHGNEPGHHIAYLYSYAGAPHKTQEKVNYIIKSMYDDAPDGLCGNDDCGQMSAWYIFSAMGFYPVCPGSNEYVFGTPFLNKAVISMESGNIFVIEAENISERNIYIQKIYLNGMEYKKTYITHDDIMKGGSLKYLMGPKPNYEFGKNPETRPYSISLK